MGVCKIEGATGERVAKRAFWLAWQACSGPLGLGFLRDNPNATEEAVWGAARGASDYDGFGPKCSRPGEATGDYVFGRMMKLHLEFTADTIRWRDTIPRIDYQAWCGKFPTCAVLIAAAAEDLCAQLVDE